MDVTQTPANSDKGKLSNQTAGRKRKRKNIFNIAYRQPANNLQRMKQTQLSSPFRRKDVVKKIYWKTPPELASEGSSSGT